MLYRFINKKWSPLLPLAIAITLGLIAFNTPENPTLSNLSALGTAVFILLTLSLIGYKVDKSNPDSR